MTSLTKQFMAPQNLSVMRLEKHGVTDVSSTFGYIHHWKMPLFICILNVHVTLNKRKLYRSFLVASPIQFQMKTGELLWRHRYIGRWLLWRHLYHNCEKYPLSPLKPRGLALLSWHVLYHWGSGNTVHPSFTQFLSLNWRKSTFYCSRVPISFQNLTADGLLWRHRHMGQPLAIVTSQWSILFPRVSMDAWCWGRRELKGFFTFLFIFGPPCFNMGHR